MKGACSKRERDELSGAASNSGWVTLRVLGIGAGLSGCSLGVAEVSGSTYLFAIGLDSDSDASRVNVGYCTALPTFDCMLPF